VSGLRLRLATRIHDWGADDLLNRLVRFASNQGWTGDATWMRANLKLKTRKVSLQHGPEFPSEVVRLVPRDARKARALSVGGDVPHPWVLGLGLAPFDVPSGRLQGMDFLALDFDVRSNPEQVVRAFAEIVSFRIAEYASVHPVESEDRMRVATWRSLALTSGLFPCVLWCNYLGPTILREFDPAVLSELSVHRIAYVPDDGGAILVVTPSYDESATKDGERSLLALTERFRLAQRKV
jgi:hypothetical protein